jgi:X-Pro dipeptidyl-peptidase
MRHGRGLCVAVTSALLALTGTAQAQIVVQNGETQPAFGYSDAIRELVFVDTDFDSDHNGINDIIAVDIIRPKATETGLKSPVIMDASPYYSTLGRGNESQKKVDDANGLLAKWPLFLDNYFVPRGYAIALVDMTGTNHSTGCPTVQGMTDNLAAATVIDWFRGRRIGHDKNGNVVPAPAWFNGKTGMIVKSYDGALAAATAVTGVAGLTTIIAESGPYDTTTTRARTGSSSATGTT